MSFEIQKAGNALRAFRWEAGATRPMAINLHPTHSFANKVGESGRAIGCYQPCPHRNFRRKFPAFDLEGGLPLLAFARTQHSPHALVRKRNQKAGNDLRAFRWGAVATRIDALNIHPTHLIANKVGESGRAIGSYQPCPHRNFRRKFPAFDLEGGYRF